MFPSYHHIYPKFCYKQIRIIQNYTKGYRKTEGNLCFFTQSQKHAFPIYFPPNHHIIIVCNTKFFFLLLFYVRLLITPFFLLPLATTFTFPRYLHH